MFLMRFCIAIFLILILDQVSSTPADIIQLKDHFIANLVEENRRISGAQLTDDIENAINLKIEGFLNLISEPATRKARDTNDLLLNEKTDDVFVLKGFESRGEVPVNFPQDICMFQLNQQTFAVALSFGKNGTSNEVPVTAPTMSIFMRKVGKFIKIYNHPPSKFLTKVDCSATKDAGYVAFVNTIDEFDLKPEHLSKQGSQVLRVTFSASGEPQVEDFQKFARLNQNNVRLWSRENSIYLMYSYNTDTSSDLNICTVYKLGETFFDRIDKLPCQNARVIEFFTVHHDLMLLIGNYQGNNGTTNTFSTIMRYDLNQKAFVEHQKISTEAIAVGKYFYLDHRDQRQHFLFIGNSFEVGEFGVINEVPSMIYKLVNGFFIPMQTINVKHIQTMLPIAGKNNEFHFLIASKDHEVQVYNYDGWKFHKSPVVFTGDSFGAGVVTMRGYDNIINGTTTIVISNRDAFQPSVNIFTPIYVTKNDSTRLKSSITKWCSDAFDRLDDFDVDETEEILKNSLELSDATSSQATFMGKLFVKNATVGTVNANEMKGRSVTFGNQTAHRVNSLTERLVTLSTAAQHVKRKVDFTRATQRKKRQTMLIRNLKVDGPLKIQSINGRLISDLVYKFNRRNTKLTGIVASEILIRENLFVNGKVDGIEMAPDNVITNQLSQNLRPFSINSISVNNIVDIAQVNLLSIDQFLTLIRRKVDKKLPNMIHELKVDSLAIGQFLNDRNFTALSIESLKTSSDQIVVAPIKIGKLTANKVTFQKVLRDQEISNIPLVNFIDVKDRRRRIDIQQDLQFTDDVKANRTIVLDRIKNVNVINQKLQVLRKKGIKQQVVTSEKFFDNVNLLSPIMLQGKIESKTLEKMNPIITINDNLVLQGDYKITGPVTLRRYINVSNDITTASGSLGLKNLAVNGLNLFTTKETSNKLVIKNVIEVKRNLEAASLNGNLVANFVRTNVQDLQTIRGVKSFKKGLLVHGGTVQADIINDVDINQLNKTILKLSSSSTQFIDGNVEFLSLRVAQLISPAVSVNGRSSDLLLNVNRPQDLSQLVVQDARVQNLRALSLQQLEGGKIFGHDLNFIVDDTVTRDATADKIIAEKEFTDLNLGRLTFAEGNEWKKIILNYENAMAQDLNVTGNVDFGKEMIIGNLIVNGSINGVSYSDMTNNWLQNEGEQVFTAPQTITSMEISNNLAVSSETVNGVNIEKMKTESVWIDAPIYVENIKIHGDCVVRSEIYSPIVNGVNIQGKLLLNDTNEHQNIKKIVVEDIAVLEFLNFAFINDINCDKFTRALGGDNYTANLSIKGNAIFNFQPRITSLNGENLKELYENIWIADRDVELRGEDIQFLKDIRIEGLIYASTINLKDLYFYYQNYLSLTRTENIATHLNINGTAIFKTSLEVEKTITRAIKFDNDEINIDDFAENVLRKEVDQTIIYHWKVEKLIFEGDFTGSINGLNFMNDVLHTGNWETAAVTGYKKIHTMNVTNVNVRYINKIDVEDWLSHSVMITAVNEQVIEGKVQLVSPVFYNDLQVAGDVNGITFNPMTILTKSGEGQYINGDLNVRTMTPQGMKSLFIENLLLRFGINGKNVSEMYEKVLKTVDSKIDSKRLVFEQPLIVGSLDTSKSIFGVNMANFQLESDKSGKIVKFQDSLEYLKHVGEDLRSSANDVAVELNHFDFHQSLQGMNIQKTVPFTVVVGSIIDFVLGVQERNTNTSLEVIKFYRWSRTENSFIDDGTMLPIVYSSGSFEITRFDKVFLRRIDHLFVEVFERNTNSYLQQLMVLDVANQRFVPVISDKKPISTQYFTVDPESSSCYGSVSPSLPNINIICTGSSPTILKTDPIRMVSSQNGLIILLTDDHQLQIWQNQKIQQVLKVMNPQNFASARHDGKLYLAVTSDRVEQSIHHGSIEIFESQDNQINFSLVQSIDLENPFMVQFSVIPSNDLLLYILTKNSGKALSVFKYAGASFFVETIQSSTIINTGSHLDTVNIDGQTEFIAVVSNEVFIIEAVLKEF